MEDQIKMAGTAANKVLSWTPRLNDGELLPSYQKMVKSDLVDPVYQAVIKGTLTIKDVRGLFALLDYDPAFRRLSQIERKNFVATNRIKLGRLLRTQMNILQIDFLLRTGQIKDDLLNSDLLREVGERIATVLDRSNSKETRDDAARLLMEEDLPAIRKEAAHYLRQRGKRGSMTKLDDPTVSDKDLRRLISSFDDDASQLNFVHAFFDKETDLLYRQVEVLILRCLRLHHIWPIEVL